MEQKGAVLITDCTPTLPFHLVHPLTKEQISTNNGSGENWGEFGTIEQVDNDGVVLQILYKRQEEKI